MKKKTRQETIKAVRDALNNNIDQLYNEKCLNWTGSTSNPDEPYTELIASEITKSIGKFNKIKTVTRSASYCRANHKNIEIDLTSNRKEEIFAKRLAYLELDNIGNVIDYQVPLKDSQKNKGLGKIDLISYNESNGLLYIIELKYKNSRETLLKTTLEAYTYSRIIDQGKLIKDFHESKMINKNNIRVTPAVLVFPPSNPYKELMELKRGIRPELRKLAATLEVAYFSLEMIIK